VRTIPGGAVHCRDGGTVVTSGTSVLSIIGAVLLILAPIAAAIYLGRRASTNARRRAVRVSSAN
jgi:ABC-type phosphate transport system permease subunit